MNEEILAKFEARSQIMKALAHPARLLIVDELSKNERCVNDLTAMIGADMSTVSRHLAVLKNAGIIQDKRQGAQVYYSLSIPCVMDFFACAEKILESRLKKQLNVIQK